MLKLNPYPANPLSVISPNILSAFKALLQSNLNEIEICLQRPSEGSYKNLISSLLLFLKHPKHGMVMFLSCQPSHLFWAWTDGVF